MRIISGTLGGRRIHPPAHMPHTRPTTDMAKEGLFNTLENNLDLSELHCLDLFGGTGSITYELASRGVKSLVAVEKDPLMFDFIKKTIAELRITDAKVVKQDVFQYLQTCNEKFDFIFAGPPYALAEIDELPRQIFTKEILQPNGWFVLEHTPRNNYSKFHYFRTERKYGTTIFSIFINREP